MLTRTVSENKCSMIDNRKKNLIWIQNSSSKFKFKIKIWNLNSQLNSNFEFKVQIQNLNYVPEVLNVHMNEIHEKLTTIK